MLDLLLGDAKQKTVLMPLLFLSLSLSAVITVFTTSCGVALRLGAGEPGVQASVAYAGLKARTKSMTANVSEAANCICCVLREVIVASAVELAYDGLTIEIEESDA